MNKAARMNFLSPGTRLGNYEVVRGMAVGGMAELYLARSAAMEMFSRLVALKRILPRYAGSHELVAMFRDEARLTAKLQHPNIAQVYDMGMCEAGMFFTMELVRGEDVRMVLGDAMERGAPVPLEHALAIVSGACAGLHAAHELREHDGQSVGLVHRDVSPSNVIVSFDGDVKIIDFGVAKARCRRTQTLDGSIKGKVSYMSPEQCMGEPLDRRSDVFALGILLWELTTTRRLHHGANDFAVLTRIAYEDAPRPSTVIPGYPPDLEEIVMRALSRDRSRRYPTADALRRDLEAFARHASLPSRPGALAGYMRQRFARSAALWQQIDITAHDRRQATWEAGRLSRNTHAAAAASDRRSGAEQAALGERNARQPSKMRSEAEPLARERRPRRRWSGEATGGTVVAVAGHALWLHAVEHEATTPDATPAIARPRAAAAAQSDMRPTRAMLRAAGRSAEPLAVHAVAAVEAAVGTQE